MGQLLGFVYALFLIICNFGKTTKHILFMQTIAFFFKTLHYYLLGGISGFLTSLISMIRNLIFYKIFMFLIFEKGKVLISFVSVQTPVK